MQLRIAKRKAEEKTAPADAEKKQKAGQTICLCDDAKDSDFTITYKGDKFLVSKSVLKMGCDMFKTPDMFNIDKESSYEVALDFGDSTMMEYFLHTLHHPFTSTFIRDIKKINRPEMVAYAKLVSYFGHGEMLDALSTAILEWTEAENEGDAKAIGELARQFAPTGKMKATLVYAHLVHILSLWIQSSKRWMSEHSRKTMGSYTANSPEFMSDLLLAIVLHAATAGSTFSAKSKWLLEILRR